MMTANTPRTLADLAEHTGAELHGDGQCEIHSIATLEAAQAGQLTFLDNPLYVKHLADTQASVVILAKEHLDKCPVNALVASNPCHAYAKVAALYDRTPKITPGIHPSAIIDESSDIDPSASIGAHCVIGAGVTIGKQVVIGAACVIGDNNQIGEGTRLAARVTTYHEVSIGKGCMLHSGVVLGADGFGLAKDQGQWQRVAQIGGVVIGDHVNIGANTTIDRGAIENTVIGDGVQLDNQIQIGHNVQVGNNTAIAACTGIAGSTRIGNGCLIGGAVAVNGHITIGDNVIIGAASGVRNSIKEPGIYSCSLSVQDERLWRKNFARLRQLDPIARRLRKVESALAEKQVEKEE